MALARCYYGSLLCTVQYRAALDLRQGVVMFHRSGDARLGLHGNRWASQRLSIAPFRTLSSDVQNASALLALLLAGLHLNDVGYVRSRNNCYSW